MNNYPALSQNNGLAIIKPASERAIKALLPGERKIIEAALQAKIIERPALDTVNDLITLLTTVYTIAGQKLDQATLAIYADEFYSKLLDTYPAITIEEIRTALKKGVYEEYGEYYGLNVKSFVFFIRSYLYSEERKAAREKFEAKLLAPTIQELTPAQKEDAKKDFINQLYTDFLQARLTTDYIPSYLFLFLEEKELIVLSNPEKVKIKNRATSYYKHLLAQEKLQIEIMKLATHTAKEPDNRITNIARQFAVYEFFEESAAKGKTKIF